MLNQLTTNHIDTQKQEQEHQEYIIQKHKAYELHKALELLQKSQNEKLTNILK